MRRVSLPQLQIQIIQFGVFDSNLKKLVYSQYCHIIQYLIKMNEMQRQFWQSTRSFLVRYNEYNRQKGASSSQLQQFEQNYSRLVGTRELKEVVINKITTIQLKSDYHNLIMLTLLQDLAKWSLQYYQELKMHSGPIQCILTQSINILNGQQQFHTIVPKQNQLISSLLSHPSTLENMEQFKILYRRLKDVKEFYPSATRDHQKQCFLKAIEQCIDRASQMNNIKTIEFIFNNIFNQLEVLEQTHQYVSQRLKILKKIIKKLWIYHEDILYKIAYLLMKYSYQMLSNRHLFNYIIPIYQNLIDKLMQKQSIVPLLVLKHLILHNISRILKNGGSLILLQALLMQLSNMFNKRYLYYFMRNYDWNYMEVPLCQQSLNILYEYVENRAHEKKPEFELIKIYINRIHHEIKIELQDLKGINVDDNKWKFYQLKKRQYFQLIEEMNKKPKKIFKRIENIHNTDVRQAVISKYVKLIKKTAHLQNRSMIDIFSTDNAISAQLFSQYVQIVLKQCKQYNLQQFMRLFTSNFFLTGESQQISRVMDTITQLYFKHQDQSNRILKSSDSTYTFFNAILILNTDLHNPKVQEKISQQNFIKMCKKINEGEDLPLQIIKKTYNNIKKNKINTFRDRGNMLGISISNWLNICTDYESLSLSYYDSEMQLLDTKCFQYFVYDVLTAIIDQKQTAKLQLLVERFLYDDKVFECQIIEILRKIVDKKSHLPLHILQKILQLANFKNNKVNDKLLSYYWLGANIIQTFAHLIPTNLICQFLVFTWNIRLELQDNMYLRQLAQIKRIKQSIKSLNKRQSKKSIMDMFSNFLSFKQSDQEIQIQPNEINTRNNFKSLSNNIFDIIKYSDQHKKLGIDFLITYIHNEESKLYQEFVSCLFLTFNLLYYIDNCQKVTEDLFYELLGVKQSSITKRLSNLAKKDNKLYNTLISYCKFWIVKLLLKEYYPSKLESKSNNNYEYLLGKSLEFFEKIDKEILTDYLKQINEKKQIHPLLFDAFQKTITKIYGNEINQEIESFFQKFKNNVIGKKEEKQTAINHINHEECKQVSSQVPQESKQDQSQKQLSQLNNEDSLKQEIKQNEPCRVQKKSIEPMQQFIDPDGMINQIQHIIDQHLKQKDQQINIQGGLTQNQKGLNELQNKDQSQSLQEISKSPKQDREQKSEEQNCQMAAQQYLKSQQTSSMPVIMF